MSLIFTGGDTDRVAVSPASAINNLNPVTIMAWVYPTDVTQNNYIWAKAASDFSVEKWLFLDNGNLGFEWGRATTYANAFGSGNPITNNLWWQVAAVWNGTAAPTLWYKNLRSTAIIQQHSYNTQNAGSGTVHDDSAENMLIGNQLPASTLSFYGRIGCVMVFNAALTQVQMAKLTYRPQALFSAVWYSHLGLPGTTCTDLIGTSNGTVTGATNGAHNTPFRRSLVT